MKPATPRHDSCLSEGETPLVRCFPGTTLDRSVVRGRLSGRVHSTFRSAVNIELPGPDVLSVVCERDALTAMTILVEGIGDMREHFEVGGEVSVSGGLLQALGISIRVTQAPELVPSAAGVGRTANDRTCRDRLARLIDLAMEGEGGDSLLGAVAGLASEGRPPWRPLSAPADTEAGPSDRNSGEERSGEDPDPVVRMIRPRIEALASALASGRVEDITGTASGLVGLGAGLTPAGDDLLCGLMLAQAYGARLPGGPGPVPALNQAVLEAASSRTHLLSRVMLARASRGITTVGLDRLLRSLVEKEPPGPVEEAARAVIELGATSGRDFLAGVVLAWTAGPLPLCDD